MSFYRENILDHYNNPRNSGVLSNPDCFTHADNPLCGDEVDVYVKLRDNTIEDLRFDAKGCAISIAAMSLLSEKVKSMTAADVLALPEDTVITLLGIPLTQTRIKCALLGYAALKQCLLTTNNHSKKK